MTGWSRSAVSWYLGLVVIGCGGSAKIDGDSHPFGAGGDGQSSGGAHSNFAGASSIGTAGSAVSLGGTSNGFGGSINAAGGSVQGGSTSQAGAAGATQQSGDLTGTWTGYVENFKFNDQSDAVKFTITPGVLGGSVVFGASPAPPPATNPQAGYPPGMGEDPGFPTINLYGPYPGFVFTMQNAVRTGDRFQFDVSPLELYQSWCALQTPYIDEVNPEGSYSCLPNWGGGSDGKTCFQTNPHTNQNVPRSCGQMALCTFNQVCTCTSTTCSAMSQQGVHFDVVVTPNKADGSVAGLDGSVHNTHLQKSN